MLSDGVGHLTELSTLPWERPGTHCTGGCVDPGDGLDRCGKSRPRGFDSRTVQPVASRYIDCANGQHLNY